MPKILIVDDDSSIRESLRRLLAYDGYEVEVAADAREAIAMARESSFHVVVSDIVMPGMSGVTLLRHFRHALSRTKVILLTGEPSVNSAAEALRGGAFDYLTKPVEPQRLITVVAAALRFGQLEELERRHHEQLESQIEERTGEIKRVLEGTIEAMARMVECRDPYTAGHQQAVGRLAKAIGEEMGLPPTTVRTIYLAGLLHDVGKIATPAEIMSKPGGLTVVEHSLVKLHPQVGYEILEPAGFPMPLGEIVMQHHERLDGSGYPNGLHGSEIRIEARIIGVADIVEAMSSHRPYRPALGLDAALEAIVRQAGQQLDSNVVDACRRLFLERGYVLDRSGGLPKH